MKSYRKLLFIVLQIITLMLTSCRTGNPVNPTDSSKNPSNAKSTPGYTMEEIKPAKSGETTKVPWNNDGKFKSAQKKNGVFVLMAAYATVLKDPLPGEEYNVHYAAQLLSGTIVNPGESFSQNRKIGPYTEDNGFRKGPTYVGSKLITTIGGGVCKIASTLYNVTILCNLPVMERHCHGMPVPYVPYGQDATVSYGAKDFRFKNNYQFPILIWSQGMDNTLFIGFYGKEKPAKVKWHHEKLEVYNAQKVYNSNKGLPVGSQKQVQEGMDGAVVKSWITIKNSDGSTKKLNLGLSEYKPMPYIIETNKAR